MLHQLRSKDKLIVYILGNENEHLEAPWYDGFGEMGFHIQFTRNSKAMKSLLKHSFTGLSVLILELSDDELISNERIEFATKFKDEYPNFPLIVLESYVPPHIQIVAELFKIRNIYSYLYYPVNIDTLNDTIEHLRDELINNLPAMITEFISVEIEKNAVSRFMITQNHIKYTPTEMVKELYKNTKQAIQYRATCLANGLHESITKIK